MKTTLKETPDYSKYERAVIEKAKEYVEVQSKYARQRLIMAVEDLLVVEKGYKV